MKELRGNPFISNSFKVTNPKDLAFGEPEISRTCDNCFYRHRFGYEKDPDCMVANNTPKNDFRIPGGETMPETIDGLQVGHYCRTWVHPEAE